MSANLVSIFWNSHNKHWSHPLSITTALANGDASCAHYITVTRKVTTKYCCKCLDVVHVQYLNCSHMRYQPDICVIQISPSHSNQFIAYIMYSNTSSSSASHQLHLQQYPGIQYLHNAAVLEGISRGAAMLLRASGHYFWTAGISGWLSAYQYIHRTRKQLLKLQLLMAYCSTAW